MGKKRKKSHYFQGSKKPRKNALEPGLKGFLITCNKREKECVREAYNLLNEYADKLYPKANEVTEVSKEDVEDDFEKELSELKHENTNEKRFQQVQSGANNCIFVKTTLPDPFQLGLHIVQNVAETGRRSRYIMRFIPVDCTCKPKILDMTDSFKLLAKKHFSLLDPKTYEILVKIRNTDQVSRDEVIPALARVIRDINPANKVDLNHPQLTVLVNVIQNTSCLSILPDYDQYKKYNLNEVGGDGISNHKDKVKSDEGACRIDAPKSPSDNTDSIEIGVSDVTADGK